MRPLGSGRRSAGASWKPFWVGGDSAISPNSGGFARLFSAVRAGPPPTVRSVSRPSNPSCKRALRSAGAALLAALAAAAGAAAEPAVVLDQSLAGEIRRFASADMARLPANSRFELRVGQLDPRLRLAPCERVQPYLPPNTRLWGRSRIGLRCEVGPKRWNVFLPITVDVYAKGLVAKATLAAGSVLTDGDFGEAEVNLSQDASPALTQPAQAVGRTLVRPVDAGQSLLQSHLAPRKWFAAGDTVRLIHSGSGFTVSGSGEALSAGLEGQRVRVRTESGRIVTGEPVGERQVDVSL